MRTVQRTYTLFGIAELEDEARQRAYTDWLAKGNDYLSFFFATAHERK